MVIAANKVKGVRAVAAYDQYSAKMSRQDNDTNILALRGRFFPFDKIKQIVDTWLKTPFSGKVRHKRRIAKIARIR
jgi:ribose 5-phosphate isomerase B